MSVGKESNEQNWQEEDLHRVGFVTNDDDTEEFFYEEEEDNDEDAEFWQHLQEEWLKMSEDPENYWLTNLDEIYDPYIDYEYTVDNYMSDIKNPMEEGELCWGQGDEASAALCFEIATQQQPDNVKAWENLGLTQAQLEKHAQAIIALKRALQLNSNNQQVIMSLASCYAYQNLHTQALQMFVRWLSAHDDYKHMVEEQRNLREALGDMPPGSRLKQVLELYEKAKELQKDPQCAELTIALYALEYLSVDFAYKQKRKNK